MLYSIIKTSTWTTGRAKELRRSSTKAERTLWKKLRAHRFHGLHFRRQVPVGTYIADFMCVQKRLIIEVDGSVHWLEGRQEKDRLREDFLRRRGFTVVRFTNTSVLENMDGVLEKLREITQCSNHEKSDPTPQPSPRRGSRA